MPGLADPDKPGTVTIRTHVRDVVPGGHGEADTGSNTASNTALPRGMPCHSAAEMRVRLARAQRRHPGCGALARYRTAVRERARREEAAASQQ